MKNYLGCDLLELASDDLILAATGSPRGFAGAVGIKARVIADYSLAGNRPIASWGRTAKITTFAM